MEHCTQCGHHEFAVRAMTLGDYGATVSFTDGEAHFQHIEVYDAEVTEVRCEQCGAVHTHDDDGLTFTGEVA